MQPKVSIQLPTYNQAAILHKAIESCLAQNYPDLEIIIADDCSPDNTEAVVLPYLSDKRVKYFRNRQNLGRVANYKNALYNHTSGDWVINLDGDDYFINDSFVTETVKLIDRHQADAVILLMHQNPYCTKMGKTSKEENYRYCLVDGIKYLEKYADHPFFLHLSSIYNRKLAITKNFYGFNSLNADFISVMQLADQGNFLLTDLKVGYWNLNENSATNTLQEAEKDRAAKGFDFLVNQLSCSATTKRKILDELIFVNNYYFATTITSYWKKIRQLFRHPRLKTYFIREALRF